MKLKRCLAFLIILLLSSAFIFSCGGDDDDDDDNSTSDSTPDDNHIANSGNGDSSDESNSGGGSGNGSSSDSGNGNDSDSENDSDSGDGSSSGNGSSSGDGNDSSSGDGSNSGNNSGSGDSSGDDSNNSENSNGTQSPPLNNDDETSSEDRPSAPTEDIITYVRYNKEPSDFYIVYGKDAPDAAALEIRTSIMIEANIPKLLTNPAALIPASDANDAREFIIGKTDRAAANSIIDACVKKLSDERDYFFFMQIDDDLVFYASSDMAYMRGAEIFSDIFLKDGYFVCTRGFTYVKYLEDI